MKKLLFLLCTLFLGITPTQAVKHAQSFLMDLPSQEYIDSIKIIDESIFTQTVISLFHKYVEEDNPLAYLVAQRIVTLWCSPHYCAQRARALSYEVVKDVEKHNAYFDYLFSKVFNDNFFIELNLPLKNEKSLFLIALQYNQEDIFLRLVTYDDEYKSKKDAAHLCALCPDEEDIESGMRLVHYAAIHGHARALSVLKEHGAMLTLRTRSDSPLKDYSAGDIVNSTLISEDLRITLRRILGVEVRKPQDELKYHLLRTTLERGRISPIDAKSQLTNTILSWASGLSLDETSDLPVEGFTSISTSTLFSGQTSQQNSVTATPVEYASAQQARQESLECAILPNQPIPMSSSFEQQEKVVGSGIGGVNVEHQEPELATHENIDTLEISSDHHCCCSLQ